MASQKQIDANRANAQRSTGPKTPEGKAASSLNALKHGLTAELAVIPGEDPDAFDESARSFFDHLQPVGPLETQLVEQIVTASWRLARLRGFETGLFTLRLIDEEKWIDEHYTGLTTQDRLAHVFQDDCGRRDAFTTLARYETRVERAFYRALHELQRLQAARADSPAPSPPAPAQSGETNPISPVPRSPINQINKSPNSAEQSQFPLRQIPLPRRLPEQTCDRLVSIL
jgi:hypothetical protein